MAVLSVKLTVHVSVRRVQTMISREQDGSAHILRMQNGQNTIDLEFLAALNEQLDAVEKETSDCAGAVVLTGEGKFFSNGLNLEFMTNATPDEQKLFGKNMLGTIRRLILFPLPVVAALNGHAFAAGCFLALACDFRIQREDRGWICVSEVDVGVPIGRPMMGLLTGKVPPQTAREAALTGKRYTAQEAIDAGFCDSKAAEEDLLPKAIEIAQMLATKERTIFQAIKKDLYREVADGFIIRS